MKNNYIKFDEEVNVKDLLLFLWSNKKQIIFINLFFIILGFWISIKSPNIYQSTAVVSPVNQSSQNLSQYAGLASIAGISLPSSGGSNQIEIGVEMLKSFSFFNDFVDRRDLFLPIVASNGWIKETNQLTYDNDIYDQKLKKWVFDEEFASNGRPSYQYAHREFMKNLTIQQDKKKGLIEISYKHHSPEIAKSTINFLITDINLIAKNKHINQAKKSIEFLNKEMQNVQFSELKDQINDLIVQQLNIMTLANTKPDFLFEIASEPVASEVKIEPNRMIIMVLMTLLGAFLGCGYVILNQYFKKL